MTGIYVPPPEAMPLLPAISKEVYDNLESANSFDRNAAYRAICQEIGNAGQARAVHIGMDIAEGELLRQREPEYAEPRIAIQRQISLAYAALLRQDAVNSAAAKQQYGLLLAGSLPRMPARSDSDESHRLADITETYCDSEAILERVREQLERQENDYMTLIVRGFIERPDVEAERLAAEIGCIGMWGVLNAYAYDLAQPA